MAPLTASLAFMKNNAANTLTFGRGVFQDLTGNPGFATLPATWLPIHERINPVSSHRPPARGRGIFGFVLLLAVLYTTMVTLASFGLMPFGKQILVPFQALLGWVAKAIMWFRH